MNGIPLSTALAPAPPEQSSLPRRAFVTGASGFIGSHLVEHLVASGYEVRALTRSVRHVPFLASLGADPVVGELHDRSTLEDACRGVDTVFHLASLVTDWAPWSEFQRNTIEGTRQILDAASQSGVPRFLHVSTVAVYDDDDMDSGRRIPEDASCRHGDRLSGQYARAKLAAEQLAWQYHQRSSLAVTVVRPACVYGPRDRTVIPRLIDYLRSKFALWIGSGNPTMDPIFVTDAVACMRIAAESRAAVGQAYNVAPADEIGMRDFFSAICRECGISPPRFTVSYRAADLVASALETVYRACRSKQPPVITRTGLALFCLNRHHDPTKAIRTLGWRPEVDLEEGLRLTVADLYHQNIVVPRPHLNQLHDSKIA